MFFNYKTIALSVLLFCLFICFLIFVHGDACFKESGSGLGVGGKGGEGGGSLGILTWALGYNFPLFLVYPIDMPVSWMFQHDYLDTCCFECLVCMCFVFAPVERN